MEPDNTQGAGVGTAGTTPTNSNPNPAPPSTPAPSSNLENPASPPGQDMQVGGQPGLGNQAPGQGPIATNQVDSAEVYRQQAMDAYRQLNQFQSELSQIALTQGLQQKGVPQEVIGPMVQQAQENLRLRQQIQMLADGPIVREMAARKAVGPYAQYGVKPEDVMDAPSPEAMVDRARTIANFRQRQGLTDRQRSGADAVESGGSGSGEQIDIDKMDGRTLIRMGLARQHR